MLKRVKKWVGLSSAILTGVVLALSTMGVGETGGTPSDLCEAACSNYIAICLSSSSSSSSGSSGSELSSSSSSSSSGTLFEACVTSCRGTSSSSSSSSSFSSSSSSGSRYSDALLICIATAETCNAITACSDSSSSSSGSGGPTDPGPIVAEHLDADVVPVVVPGTGGAGLGGAIGGPTFGVGGSTEPQAPAVAGAVGTGPLVPAGTGGETGLPPGGIATDPPGGLATDPPGGLAGDPGLGTAAPSDFGSSGGCSLQPGQVKGGVWLLSLLGLAWFIARRRSGLK